MIYSNVFGKEGNIVEQIRREKALNIPNVLTVIRICLLPAVVWRFRRGDSIGALVIYLIAMFTDAVDGFIARRFNQITSIGKLLDPIADKLSLIVLLWLFVADGQIPPWVLGVMLGKEIALIIGGAAALRRGIVSYALPIGKVTTVSFILSMAARFLGLRSAADMLLYTSLLLSMVALVWYALAMSRRLSGSHADSTK